MPNINAVYITQGSEYTLDVISCVGEVLIKPRQYFNQTSDYLIRGCTFDNTYWRCQCNKGSTPIIIETKKDTNNSYYFVSEYYVKAKGSDEFINDRYKRTEMYSDINVGKKVSVVSQVYKKDGSLNYGLILVIVIIGIIFVIGSIFGIIYIIKKLKEDDREVSNDEYNNLRKRYNNINITDDMNEITPKERIKEDTEDEYIKLKKILDNQKL